MRLKMVIEYKGTDFLGWQIQPKGKTVQGTIQETLERIFQYKIRVIGASRTDRGIHSKGQVAHFDISPKKFYNKFSEPEELKKSLNAMLPQSIYIHHIEHVSNLFHARFSAIAKKYEYSLLLKPSPILQDLYWIYPYPLKIHPLYKMAHLLIGKRDMKNWAQEKPKDGMINIMQSQWTKRGEKLFYEVIGDRFLNKLIRSLVGQMVFLASQGDPEKFTEYLENGPQRLKIAPPQGLCLVEIFYK